MAAAGAGDDAPVDVEVLLAAFIKDDSCKQLELPRSLTADQRKQAKRLAEKHGGLKCESFGFGEDRQMFINKKDQVRVKNTFIDDWEGSAGGEEAIFRSAPTGSMPVDLLARTLERCRDNDQQPPVPVASVPEEPSPGGTAPDLPPLPEGFQVRNTFIHIESVPAVERIVQSMPDGMFRQCLAAEMAAQAGNGSGGAVPAAAVPTTAAAGTTGTTTVTAMQSPPRPAPVAAATAAQLPPVTAAVAPAGQPTTWAPGTEVVIQGLVKLPDFNGLSGVVQSLDEASGRYDVLLDGPAGQCGWRWVKVKGENCRPRMPPPPCNAPTIFIDAAQDGQEEDPGAVPPTPHWEDDFNMKAGLQQDANAAPLKLDALV
mmetsp:Transcript_58926/g.116724  ORF Transcript_58926/g.116724 Transcript_58926/m.116724 type:complete len:371 (-) Transcript_58926:196-1308(-)|eukprot:CAMPEP_0172715388 /NCGR_PEP_ID=MMETSP1074-20121228/67516_1 /TAXON_ID=2916 /ORGANISM="Ceratium fusus, Strain PA161109" /LENGTH=370 /DNA_ID=CAMNT_0013539961 /DNA_START=51 /DNA_END=1163 /DNA_ORIENTATION=+